MSAFVDKEVQLFSSRVHPCRDDGHCFDTLQLLIYLISQQRINVQLAGYQMYSTSVNPSIQEQTDSPQVTFIHQPSGDYHPSSNKRTALGSPSSIQEQTDRSQVTFIHPGTKSPHVTFIHPGTKEQPSGDHHPSRNKRTALGSPSSIQEQTDSTVRW